MKSFRLAVLIFLLIYWLILSFQSFTVFYDYKEHKVATFTVDGNRVKTNGNSVIINNLLACETYIFAVAVTGPPKSKLSAFSLQKTDAGKFNILRKAWVKKYHSE